MVTGFTQILSNLMSLIGILFLIAIGIVLLGIIKSLIDVIILQSKTSRINKKLAKIERKANEVLKDFRTGASFMGIAKAVELGKKIEGLEIEELEKITEEEKK